MHQLREPRVAGQEHVLEPSSPLHVIIIQALGGCDVGEPRPREPLAQLAESHGALLGDFAGALRSLPVLRHKLARRDRLRVLGSAAAADQTNPKARQAADNALAQWARRWPLASLFAVLLICPGVLGFRGLRLLGGGDGNFARHKEWLNPSDEHRVRAV